MIIFWPVGCEKWLIKNIVVWANFQTAWLDIDQNTKYENQKTREAGIRGQTLRSEQKLTPD